jgi:hypothetical protein
MLGRFQHIVSKGWFSISAIEHKDLVTQIRVAKYKENGILEKSEIGDKTETDSAIEADPLHSELRILDWIFYQVCSNEIKTFERL